MRTRERLCGVFNKKKKTLAKLRVRWGKRGNSGPDFQLAALYHNGKVEARDIPGIDDKTWQDIDMACEKNIPGDSGFRDWNGLQ
ncbi:MAG: hypothetical protein GY765_32110 [bacterium]|nr:hypothetical protein [bacterium]